MQNKLPHWLTKQAALSPNKVAIQFSDGTCCTFLELKEKSLTYARKLASLGVQKQTRVAILSGNSEEMVITLYAISYLKAVAVLLNTRLTAAELTFQLHASNTNLLVTSVDIDTKLFDNQKTFKEMEQLEEVHIAVADEINLNETFTMMFTSGTTGQPKMVVHTYGNHWWSAIGSVLNLGLEPQDKWLLTLPIFHVGGLSILMRGVIYGIEVYLMEHYDADAFYQALHEKKITIASIVTVMLQDLLSRLEDAVLPEQVRCLLLGGGSVPEILLNQVKKKQLPSFQSYGMTETSSQIVTLSAENALTKIGSAGKPLFPAEIKIMDKDLKGIGEIVVKGPMVINGYYNNPTANEKAFKDDWFKTGDLGYIDDDGFLFVVERRNDLIISGGENIYPREIENVLLEMENIEDAAVAGVPNERWGQVPVAFVVIRNEQVVSKEAIMEYLSRKLAAYKLPKDIRFMKELPRNASNKVMRHKLKEDF